jgi:hypothetical protein
MVHPCRTKKDTAGSNPRFKMHAVESGSEKTICGLEEVFDIGRRHQYTSLCPVCWPAEPAPTEEPWTGKDPNPGREGDTITGREENEG